MHLAPLDGDVVVRIALVVLDIALVVGPVALGGALELGEDILVGFAPEVGQHVEPTAVGHADHHFLHTQLRTGLDQRVQ